MCVGGGLDQGEVLPVTVCSVYCVFLSSRRHKMLSR